MLQEVTNLQFSYRSFTRCPCPRLASCSYIFRTDGLCHLLNTANWQINSKLFSFFWNYFCTQRLFLCTLPLISCQEGKYQLFITAPDKQMPASTQWARWRMKSSIHSGQNTQQQQQRRWMKVQIQRLMCDLLHGDTCVKTTHVRPQPGPSDWLLLPACCILDRSMCSTYVWIICDPRGQDEEKMREERERNMMLYTNYALFYCFILL